MANEQPHHDPHDWQSQEYVADWNTRDAARTAQREPILNRMLAAAPFSRDADIAALDVGGGSGVVSQALLQAFPRATVTLQDYSGPMLERARERFADRVGQMHFVTCDLRDPAWEQKVGGPFDLAVSGIAIHNLFDMTAIAACYGGIRRLLKPGGCFLDYDHFDRVGDIAAHRDALRSAGFKDVETIWYQAPTGVLKAMA